MHLYSWANLEYIVTHRTALCLMSCHAVNGSLVISYSQRPATINGNLFIHQARINHVYWFCIIHIQRSRTCSTVFDLNNQQYQDNTAHTKRNIVILLIQNHKLCY